MALILGIHVVTKFIDFLDTYLKAMATHHWRNLVNVSF